VRRVPGIVVLVAAVLSWALAAIAVRPPSASVTSTTIPSVAEDGASTVAPTVLRAGPPPPVASAILSAPATLRSTATVQQSAAPAPTGAPASTPTATRTASALLTSTAAATPPVGATPVVATPGVDSEGNRVFGLRTVAAGPGEFRLGTSDWFIEVPAGMRLRWESGSPADAGGNAVWSWVDETSGSQLSINARDVTELGRVLGGDAAAREAAGRSFDSLMRSVSRLSRG
jgi:hypothetical protein